MMTQAWLWYNEKPPGKKKKKITRKEMDCQQEVSFI